MKTINAPSAPAAIGPYSQAKIVGNLLFTAGQIPLVPETMEMVTGSIEPQTERVLQNLSAILKEAGYGLEDVVRVGVWLDDPHDFWSFNGVYAEYFGANPPARACVQSHMMVDCKIEIDCVAYRADRA